MRRVATSRVLLWTLLTITVCNVVGYVLERRVATPLRVSSISMEPRLVEGDRVLVRRMHGSSADRAHAVRRGDIVVIRPDGDDGPLLVKRVVALPGESIEARDGLIAIDNVDVLEEPWLTDEARDPDGRGAISTDVPRTFLEDDEVYVLGDNREHSVDSRSFGSVSGGEIAGRVVARMWPPDRASTEAVRP